MNGRMLAVARLFYTLFAILMAALVWLYLLEEMGFGSWQCWPN